MVYEKEYFTRKSMKLFNEAKYHQNPQKYYMHILEQTREWNTKHHHLKNILTALSKNYSEDDYFYEKTGMIMNALIHNSSDLS